ncbi:MAG: hypothetical protein IT228_04465 [Flavobacteriales bacterium]|nr:hypothetical protein [Flavobacteriales bacterium]MCC6576577.1 hypothetical protein [Flavobacteriales bacterium]NUQ15697.1 hypothetical protein [Flavobacteriales bacterium]
MRTLFALALALGTSMMANAQGVITRQWNGQSFFYYAGELQQVFDDAETSVGQDTVILAGGQYLTTTDLFIRTPIVLMGSGVFPDSVTAYGGRTTISGSGYRNLRIMEDADGTEVHGIAFVGSIGVRLGSDLGTSDADDVVFSRCEIEALYLGSGNFGSNANNPLVEQCIITSLDLNECTDPAIRNCVIGSMSGGIATTNAQVEQCMFFNFGLNANVGNEYTNCIFIRNQANAFVANEQDAIFRNNLFVGQSGFSFSIGANATDGGGNVSDSPINTVNGAFPQLTSTSYTVFAHGDDYTPAAQWLTAGQGSTQVGIYGGARPWKDGLLPFNPHWIELIAPSTTVNGTLQGVQIKASAQQP